MAGYESESKLEDRMIEQLVKQGYEQVVINDVSDLENNFRKQVNKHNQIELKGKDLSDKEFERLMVKISGKGVFQSAKELRQKQDIQSRIISTPNSKTKVYVIPTNEEYMILKDTYEISKLLEEKNAKKLIK